MQLLSGRVEDATDVARPGGQQDTTSHLGRSPVTVHARQWDEGAAPEYSVVGEIRG